MSVQKFRKKPVVIEAMRVDRGAKNRQEALRWIGANGGSAYSPSYDSLVIIVTLEGDMAASPGDYIIRGVNGEFYPCKPDIFEKTYEEA